MQPRIPLPLYDPPVPSATLVQTLLTFHPHPLILKLLLALNICFALLLIACHLVSLVTHILLFLTNHLSPLFPSLTPKLLLLLPFLLLPVLPLSLVSVLFLLLTNFLLHPTTSLPLLLLTALGVTGILFGVVIGDPRRRRPRPRRRQVPPSPWPERLHIADWTWDDQDDVVPNPEWEMPEGLATRVPHIYGRLGVHYYFYRRLRETRRRRGMPEALRLGRYSNYFKIDGGESEERRAA